MVTACGCTDGHAEWFELFNPAASAVSMSGFALVNDIGDRHVMSAGLVVAPRTRVTLGRCNDSALNGGVRLDYVYRDFSLNAISDAILIFDHANRTVSAKVAWTDCLEWNSKLLRGRSMQLSTLTADVSDPASWCVGNRVYGTGNLGSPGAPNTCNEIVISEIMANPQTVTDMDGEWFEVHNPGDSDVNLLGWQVSDGKLDHHVVSRPLVVGPGVYAVLARNQNYSSNGNVQVAYEYRNFVINNRDDTILLYNADDELVDAVRTDAAPWIHPVGRCGRAYAQEWAAGAVPELRDFLFLGPMRQCRMSLALLPCPCHDRSADGSTIHGHCRRRCFLGVEEYGARQ